MNVRVFVVASLVGALAGSIGSRPADVRAASTPDFSYNHSAPLDVRVIRTWRDASASYQELTFASPVRGRVHAEIVAGARNGLSRGPGILFVHWLGDPKTTNLTEFAADARALAARGVTSLLVDAQWAQRGWFEKVRKPDTDYADSVRQVVDLRRALDVLAAQPGVDPANIAYVGHDFGAMYGAILSAVDPRPRCYALMAGVPTLSEWFLLGTAPKDKPAYLAQMAPLDPVAFLSRSKARCFLFQDALKDEYVPVKEAEAFAAAAPGERASYLYQSDHALAKPQITSDRLAWLAARLLSADGTSK